MLRALAVLTLLVAALPLAAAQETPHENFARAATDLESLEALGRTLLNASEVALTYTVDGEDANATRRARLGVALTADLDEIAALSDVDSAAYLEPLVVPYSSLADHTTIVTDGFARARETGRQAVPLLRADVLSLLDDADAFDALGHDTTRLRALIALLTIAADELAVQAGLPPPPYLILVVEPRTVTLGERLVARGVIVPAPPPGLEVRLLLDDAQWRTARADRNGAFRVEHDLALDTRIGAHEVDGEANAHGQMLRANATFQVQRIPMVLTLEPERDTFSPRQDVVLRARLVDHERVPLPSATLRLTLDGGEPVNVTLLSDGAALIRYPAGALALGEHTARASYAGDALHEPAAITARWTVALLVDAPETPAAPLAGVLPAWLRDILQLPAWAPWVLVLFLALFAEGATRAYLRLHPEALAAAPAHERRARAAVERLVPVPRSLAPNDPRRIILLAYRDVLLALAREGVAVARLTHREIGRLLLERGRDPESVRLVTTTFEGVRYGRAAPPEGILASYLPSVLRLVRPGGA